MRNHYSKEIPALWNNTRMAMDQAVHMILAIGYKYNIPYLQLLVDDYNRQRVKNSHYFGLSLIALEFICNITNMYILCLFFF